MALLGPDEDDKRKIHSEVNQIVNQRMSLTFLTVTVFGAMIAWITPKNPPIPASNIGAFTYLGAILLIVLLFALFLLTYYLSYMLRLFSTYLDETNSSNWEKDWAAYRSRFRYIGYTKPLSIIFLLLGTGAAGYPFILMTAYSLTLEPIWGAYICLIAYALYLILVFGMGILGWLNKESDIRLKWKELKHN